MKQISTAILLGLNYALLFGFSGVSCDLGYMLTFPQTLQIGAREKFCLELYNISGNVDLYLNISCYGRSVQHHPKTFRAGESDCFVWSLPHSLTAGTCNIDIKGEDGKEGGYMFTKSKEIKITDTHQITFIQTDKPVYKPKDSVKFRLLTVTQDLKPLKATIDSVTIHDPHDFYMRQWLDVQSQAGLVSLDYRLYDEPVLGDWKIVAVVNGRKTEQTFSVQQYVLPKFQLHMKLPKSLTVATKSLEFEVCAKYTFGKPVTGSVNASVCLENTETSWFCKDNLRPCAYIKSKMDGCHNFTVETKLLKITERKFSLLCKPRLMVHANVTEKETGLTVEEKQQGVGVWEERVKLKFVSDKYFKPFFPYTGKLYAWKPDGSPAVGEKVTFTVGKLGIIATLYTDKTGHAEFNIQDLTHSTPYFVLDAKTDDSDYTDKKYYTIFPATTKKHVKQWYSPTSSYVRLSTVHRGERRCGETITIDVVHSIKSDINIQSVTAQIMSKGNIVEHTDITEEMSRSSPYLPFLKGSVFTPRLTGRSPHITDDDDDDYYNKLLPGPLSDLEAGPPGSQAAGPPGSATGTKHSADQENLELDKAMADEPETAMMPPIALKASVSSPHTVKLTWVDSTLGMQQKVTDNRYYTIRLTSKPDEGRYKYVNSTELVKYIDNLQPGTQYEFSVHVSKGSRKSVWSRPVSSTTQEAAPGPMPHNLTVIAVAGDPLSVTLTWQPPQEPDGQIRGYLVFYTTDPAIDDHDWIVEGVLGDKLSMEINDLTPDTTYYFKVQARSSKGYGPMSPTTAYKTPKIESSKHSRNKFSEMATPSLRHFSVRQYISGDMAPKMRVLVYMITNTREMVADTLDIDVGHCYNNQVNMTFKEKTVRPGDTVDMTLKASPGSLCSAGMVDKSVYLHGGMNLLQGSDIDDRLKAYDLTSDFINDWQYCSDLSVLPPDMTNPGPENIPIGFPAYDDSTDFVHGPFSRKRRSIMQYYSNMYDALLAFKVAGLEVMTDLDLQTRPCLHDGDILGPPHLPGDPRGPIPGPGGELEALEPTEEPVDSRDPVSSLRRNFPDTWLWELYEVPASGSVTITETIPDTITEWVGNTVCTNENSGLGVSDVSKITTFQPFFISVKLPYSVIREEILSIDVMVFNYLSHCVAIQLTIVENGKFTFANEDKESVMCICSEKSKSHTFKIKLIELGRISIEFSAFLREHRVSCYSNEPPANYSNKPVTEQVVKHLLVQAEGIPEETTKSQFICPQDSVNDFQRTVRPDLPDSSTLVPGSLRGWVSVIGDIMGPVLNGLEDLILLPTGCGEQNMIRLAPNVAILEYLSVTNQLTEDIEIKTVDHLNKGYQQQLTFMHKDGSYSAFGTADDAGSTWLSAFVFKTLQQAVDFIYIDRKQIQTKTWEFLINQQGEDGCFIERGKILSKYMMGGVIGSRTDKKRALTAYVLVSMLESFKMMRERTPPFVALAVRCIQVDNLTDTYTHALVAYAMTLYKPNSRFTEILLKRLIGKAQIDGDTMFWKREKMPAILSGQGRAASAEIEITSYALLALLTKDRNTAISDIMPIVRWLTNQRNAYGGFASTQDTVVALQALSLFAQRIYGGGFNVDVNIVDDYSHSKDISVTHRNSIIQQRYDLVNPESDLYVTAKGEGCVLMQTTYKYNVQNKLKPADIFKLTVSTPVTEEAISNNCRQRIVKVCASYHGDDEMSNMAVIEVKLASGWMPDVKSLQYLVNSVEINLKKYEMDKHYPDVVNFYFDELHSSRLCFEFTIVLEVEVDSQKPSAAKVFDYYESELETTIFYEMTPCSEEYLEHVDVSINGDADLYIEGDGELTINNNHIQSDTLTDEAVNVYENVPAPVSGPDDMKESIQAPPSGPQCPQCVTTGVVNVLHSICKKQVWILEPDEELGYSLKVVAADGISPELIIAMPESLEICVECINFFADKGEKSIMFLEPYDWTDLGMNIAQQSTVIIPWSTSLQTSIQQVLKSCVNH